MPKYVVHWTFSECYDNSRMSIAQLHPGKCLGNVVVQLIILCCLSTNFAEFDTLRISHLDMINSRLTPSTCSRFLGSSDTPPFGETWPVCRSNSLKHLAPKSRNKCSCWLKQSKRQETTKKIKVFFINWSSFYVFHLMKQSTLAEFFRSHTHVYRIYWNRISPRMSALWSKIIPWHSWPSVLFILP